jgi:hypothetical protein
MVSGNKRFEVESKEIETSQKEWRCHLLCHHGEGEKEIKIAMPTVGRSMRTGNKKNFDANRRRKAKFRCESKKEADP